MAEDGLRYESRIVRITTYKGETTEEIIDVLEIYWNEEQALMAENPVGEDGSKAVPGMSLEALEDMEPGREFAALTAEVVRGDVKEWLGGDSNTDPDWKYVEEGVEVLHYGNPERGTWCGLTPGMMKAFGTQIAEVVVTCPYCRKRMKEEGLNPDNAE
jgi:hypothetical protein